jgi:site-specific DNA-cytosine methylase
MSHSPRCGDPNKGGTGPLVSEEHSFTLDSTPHNDIMRSRQDFKIRRLTPIECERLQGFPDNWTEGFSDTQRYKMLGNAVTVKVIRSIFDRWKF